MKRLYFSLLVCALAAHPSVTSRLNAAEPESPAFEYKDLDTKPVPIRPIRVRFPFGVRKKGEPAEIVLRFLVTKKGTVTNVTVVRFTHPGLIEAAMETYERARFTPGTKEGVPVDAWMEATESLDSK